MGSDPSLVFAILLWILTVGGGDLTVLGSVKNEV